MTDPDKIAQALAEPFDPAQVKVKPQTISGNRALAVHFVDARVVQDRLDEVVGVMGWQDSYECLPDGAVVCRLRLKVGGEWIVKEDVGGQSEQPDEGDRRKAAFSDALKRAAVKFGVGRYLYRLKKQWADYDPQKKQFVRPLTLPDWALPGPKPATEAKSQPPSGLYERAKAFGQRMVKAGLIGKASELSDHLKQAFAAKYQGDLRGWPESAAQEVREACKAFEAARRAAQSPVNPEQLRKLDAELSRTGEAWPRVRLKLGMDDGLAPAQMTQAQWQEAMDALGETEVAEEAAV